MKIQNPILRGFNPDPSLCRVGDDYYIATSTFEWYPGVQIHHSKDLQNWTLATRPLNRAAQLDMRGNPDSCGIWAPSLSYDNGQFWLIYTNVRRYDGNYKDAPNFLVTAPSIEGPWSDPIYMNASGFDPSLFHDGDGRKWFVNMIWDHRATMAHRTKGPDFFGGILLQEYDHEARKLIGPIKRIFHRSPHGLTEAPHLLKRNGYYYLITAEGGTGYDHAVTHARARNVDGPYELHPNTHVLTTKDAPESPLQRVGHGQPCDGPEDGTMLHTFLCSRPLPNQRSPMGRESGIDVMEWGEDDWLYLRDNTTVPQAGSSEIAKSEDISSFKPGPLPDPFQWLRSPEPNRLFSTEARPGWLRMFGRESVGSWFEQSLVARRQTEHICSAEVTMEADPQTYQHMSGLIAYYGRFQFHYLYLTQDDDGDRCLNIQSCNGNWPDGDLSFPLGEGEKIANSPIQLGLDIKNGTLTFRYRLGQDWQDFGPKLDASVLSDEGGRGEHANFTGCFLGICANDLAGHGQPADFKDFAYRTG